MRFLRVVRAVLHAWGSGRAGGVAGTLFCAVLEKGCVSLPEVVNSCSILCVHVDLKASIYSNAPGLRWNIKLRQHMLLCRVELQLLLLLLVLARCDEPALAGDLDLASFEGRVDACAPPLVADNDTCTCDAGWTSNGTHGACAECAVGFYKTEPGVHACSSCPPHTTSFAGAAEAADCVCVAGFEARDGACEACGVGSYKSFVGNSSCVACPANSNTLNTGASSLELCLCLPGHVASADGACNPCPPNTFSEVLGALSCSLCPVHSGAQAAATSAASCECEAGYTAGQGQDLCTACPASTYKPERSMNTCTPCPDNMFSPTGTEAISNCTCSAGYERINLTACELCALDAYCPGADAKHSCPGNSSTPRGAHSVASCTCLPGFFLYHTTCELCSEDYYCANNTRVECPANSSAPIASSTVDNCTCLHGFHSSS